MTRTAESKSALDVVTAAGAIGYCQTGRFHQEVDKPFAAVADTPSIVAVEDTPSIVAVEDTPSIAVAVAALR